MVRPAIRHARETIFVMIQRIRMFKSQLVLQVVHVIVIFEVLVFLVKIRLVVVYSVHILNLLPILSVSIPKNKFKCCIRVSTGDLDRIPNLDF